jgi:hypothetical protein
LDKIGLFVFKTSIGENRQDEILSDVAEFPNDSMPEVEFLRREAREKEREQWNDDPRSLAGREDIRREKENHDQPYDERSPVLEDQFLH